MYKFDYYDLFLNMSLSGMKVHRHIYCSDLETQRLHKEMANVNSTKKFSRENSMQCIQCLYYWKNNIISQCVYWLLLNSTLHYTMFYHQFPQMPLSCLYIGECHHVSGEQQIKNLSDWSNCREKKCINVNVCCLKRNIWVRVNVWHWIRVWTT